MGEEATQAFDLLDLQGEQITRALYQEPAGANQGEIPHSF
jgi:hypothetical protein